MALCCLLQVLAVMSLFQEANKHLATLSLHQSVAMATLLGPPVVMPTLQPCLFFWNRDG